VLLFGSADELARDEVGGAIVAEDLSAQPTVMSSSKCAEGGVAMETDCALLIWHPPTLAAVSVKPGSVVKILG
jgi:hypothetical protein